MNSQESPEVAPLRLSGEDRREQILEAATVVFAERGYVGGTTDAVAKQAAISQAYVVRMFGSKERLFVEVARRAAERVTHGFRGEIATFDGTESYEEKKERLGSVYAALVADRGILLVLMHLFSLGHDATFGPTSRRCFLDIYRMTRDEAGMTPEQTSAFMAQGMLMNTILAMRLPDIVNEDPDALELVINCGGTNTAGILEGFEEHR